MDMFKIITSGVLAFALFAGCVSFTPSNVAATGANYLRGDIDGNGEVTLTDLGYLANFLRGYKATADDYMSQRLDVDLSGVIDKTDLSMLSSILVGNMSTESLAYESSNIGIPVQSGSVSYRKYNAQTGIQEGSNYTLNSLSLISNQETRHIFGDDDRELYYSQSGVVKLLFTINGVRRPASGFIVGDHTILTAAHCVYDTENDIPASNISYTTYNSNGRVNSVSNAKSYHLPQKYIDCSRYSSWCDYALITVDEDFSYSGYEIYNLGIARNIIKNDIESSVYENLNSRLGIYVSGYSSDTQNLELLGEIVTGCGNFLCDMINNDVLFYNTDTVGGESGGPVYVRKSDGDITVIGINSGHNRGTPLYNLGKRIDTDIIHFVYNNPNL